MPAQQFGQRCARLFTIEAGDRIADVGLVLQQPLGRHLRIRQVGHRAHDVEPCPGDMVHPQIAHGDMEAFRILGQARRAKPVGELGDDPGG